MLVALDGGVYSDHSGVKLARWYSSPCGRRVVRSEIARY